MQTKMFVFIGVPILKNIPTIDELHDRLKIICSPPNDSLQFTKVDQLLTTRYNDISYYLSILESKKEIKDWLQMANDFELSSDITILTENNIIDRYNKLRITKPGLYSETAYSIGMAIYNALKQFGGLNIISFQ